MTGRDGVRQQVPNAVRYIHMMFETHQLVLSNGYWTESFQPSSHAMRGVEAAQRDELLRLFPQLRKAAARDGVPAVRRALKGYESELLMANL